MAPHPLFISILEEKEETLSAVDFQAIGFLLAFVDGEARALSGEAVPALDATKATTTRWRKPGRRRPDGVAARLSFASAVDAHGEGDRKSMDIALYKDALRTRACMPRSLRSWKARKLLKDMKECWTTGRPSSRGPRT